MPGVYVGYVYFLLTDSERLDLQLHVMIHTRGLTDSRTYMFRYELLHIPGQHTEVPLHYRYGFVAALGR